MGEFGASETSVNGDFDKYNEVNGGNGVSSQGHFDHSNVKNAVDVGSGPPPIAITGMAMRLPGGANSDLSFWDLILNKESGRCQVPASRYNIDAFYDPKERPGSVKTQYGYFIDDYDLQCFDASFFSMSKPEIERIDPQQRMFLEVVRECLESGGKTSWRGDKIGCFAGSFGEDWLDLGAKDVQNAGPYRITGSGDFVLANRVSYEYDFKGPRYDARLIIRVR